MNHKIAAITAAANFNKTNVQGEADVSTITDPALQARLFARDEKGRVEEAQPRHKISINFNYKFSKLTFNVRTTRFGEVATLFRALLGGLGPAVEAAGLRARVLH